MDYSSKKSLLATLLTISLFFYFANSQISTPCTTSMITTFSPCLNYITGSSGTGSSPTKDCCNSLNSLMATSMDCTCLIITGNVPVSIPFINGNLGISLPSVCKSSVPLQCKASGVPLPAPGPVLFGPNAAPIAPSPSPHSHSPTASKAATGAVVAAPSPADDQVLDFSPASPPEFQLRPTANPGIRPVLQPNSASNLSISLSLFVVLTRMMVSKLL